LMRRGVRGLRWQIGLGLLTGVFQVLVSFGEPSDPQRVGPPYELTPAAESDRSRRFAFPAFSARNRADSPVSAGASRSPRCGFAGGPYPRRFPPHSPSLRRRPTRVDAGRDDPQKAPADQLVGRAEVCQNRNGRSPAATHCHARGYDMAGQSIWGTFSGGVFSCGGSGQLRGAQLQ
jgi:hypothetical protein